MQSVKGISFALPQAGLLKLLLVILLGSIAIPLAETQDVLTYHNDNARTGQNLTETILTPGNVNSTTFGKLFVLPVDGKVDAQPLYVSALVIPGNGVHNVVIVATEHDSVYAFDADTGTVLWQVSLLKPGETTSDALGCNQVTPEIGITATPVIDRNSGPNGTIYVVAMSTDGFGNYFQRLHALDLTTGQEEFGGPTDIQATFPGNGGNSQNGTVVFDPKQYEERAGLLLLNNVIYTTWSSHCDFLPYTGWVIGYDATSLAQVSVLNITPNGNYGAIWGSGAGPASDNDGNIYVLVGNGTFDSTLDVNGFPALGDYGNGFLKLSTATGLAVSDYFEMYNQQIENDADGDLGSGGALVLPDLKDGSGHVWHLAVGAGKDNNLYLVDRDNMGKFNPDNNDAIYQELPRSLPDGVWGMPAYFNNRLYYGAILHPILAFQFSDAKLLAIPVSQTTNSFGYPGPTPSVSANNDANGIVWAAENTDPAILHAYDATDLSHELYNSNQAPGGRDHFGAGNKFITPTIAKGKVYVGTRDGVGAFGLLAPGTPAVSFSPTKLNFPPQLLNTSSAARGVTLTNTGTGILTISSITPSGNFSQTNTCGTSLAAGLSCTIMVTFTPSVSGAIPGTITVVDNTSDSPQVVGLAGTGVDVVSLSPTKLDFGTVTVGTTSGAKAVTLSNNQTTSLSFNFSASSAYKATGGGTRPCGNSLPGKSRCTILVTFSPKQNGLISGALGVTGVSFATQLANLSGTGTGGPSAPLIFSPAALTFQAQLIGTTSATKTVTVRNSSNGTVTISSLSASADFTVIDSGTNPCVSSLTPGARCRFTVTFSPSIAGVIKGAVAITDDSPVSPQVYNLSGTGVLAVRFAPASLTFPPTPVGSTSSPQTVTMTNNQSIALDSISIVASGQYAAVPSGSTPCGNTLAAHAQCTFDVTFTPSATGTIPGVVTVTHDASGSPQEVSLTGTGT